MPINLNEARQGGLKKLKEVSAKLNSGNDKLDCSGVFGLTKRELKALFSNIRQEWRHQEELERFIDMNTNTLTDELFAVFVWYLRENSDETKSRLKIHQYAAIAIKQVNIINYTLS